MLALYRSGQRAAALDAYRRAWRQLVDQVGIEPGPGLRELNQRILRSDPALLPAPAAPSAPPASAAPAGPAARGARATRVGPPSGPRHDGRADGRDAAVPDADRAMADRAMANRAMADRTMADRTMANRAMADGADADGPGPADRGPAPPRPAMLPAAVPGFTGRSRELEALSALLAAPGDGPGHPSPGGTPVVITAIGGTAGVGKTALAVHCARQAAARFPDGQLYVNLRGFGPSADPLTPAEVLREVLDALHVPAAQIPAGLAARQAMYRSLLASQQVLILLDNARDPAQVRPLLPTTPPALVLTPTPRHL